MIRSIRPTDLLSLARFVRRRYGNLAYTWRNVGNGQSDTIGAAAFFDHWLSIDENRYTWISIEGRQIDGLISVRHLAGHSVWEIDRVALSEEAANSVAYPRLLDYVSAVGGENGVHKIFLRLDLESPLLMSAQKAGYFPYTIEESLVRTIGRDDVLVAPEVNLNLRRRAKADAHAIFQIYSAAVPSEVRRARAMTLEEWQDSREHCGARGARREYVVETDGRVVASLEIVRYREDGYFDLLVHPDAVDLTEPLVEHAIYLLRGSATMRCLVPSYAVAWRSSLMRHGFEPQSACHSLVKQLAVRVKSKALLPVRA